MYAIDNGHTIAELFYIFYALVATFCGVYAGSPIPVREPFMGLQIVESPDNKSLIGRNLTAVRGWPGLSPTTWYIVADLGPLPSEGSNTPPAFVNYAGYADTGFYINGKGALSYQAVSVGPKMEYQEWSLAFRSAGRRIGDTKPALEPQDDWGYNRAAAMFLHPPPSNAFKFTFGTTIDKKGILHLYGGKAIPKLMICTGVSRESAGEVIFLGSIRKNENNVTFEAAMMKFAVRSALDDYNKCVAVTIKKIPYICRHIAGRMKCPYSPKYTPY